MEELKNIPYQTPGSSLQDNAATSAPALYRLRAAGIASFFGSPVAGAWVITQNLKSLRRAQEAKKVWLVAVGITVINLIIGIFLSEKIPSQLLVFMAAYCMHIYAKQSTAEALAAHAVIGGSFLSNWRAFGVSLLIAAIYIAGAVAFVYIQNYIEYYLFWHK